MFSLGGAFMIIVIFVIFFFLVFLLECLLLYVKGNYGAQGMIDFMNESKLMDLLNSSDYVPTYEDKDGDWMLVGDVPWE